MWNAWGETRNIYRTLMGKSEGSRLLGRLRRRWKDYIKTYHKETAWQRGLYRCGVAEGRDKRRPVVRMD
jgi:hypothetical protein